MLLADVTAFCTETAEIWQFIGYVFFIFKIAIPILLIIFGMLDLGKAVVASKEDEIKKGQQIFIKRLISGALVFFVFTIVQLIVSFAADENDESNIMTCSKCFITGKCSYYPETNDGCKTGTTLNSNGVCVKTK